MSKKPPAGKIAAVILAAGGSSRLGYSKQLLQYKGEALVRRAAASAIAGGAQPVIVVTGADSGEISLVLRDLPGVTTCENSDWESGLASSLRAGLLKVQADLHADGALVMLSDQPRISAVDIRRLLLAFQKGARIVASSYDDTVGAPIVVAREFFSELTGLSGDAGAGQWLRKHPDLVAALPMPHAGADIDTPQDVQHLLATD